MSWNTYFKYCFLSLNPFRKRNVKGNFLKDDLWMVFTIPMLFILFMGFCGFFVVAFKEELLASTTKEMIVFILSFYCSLAGTILCYLVSEKWLKASSNSLKKRTFDFQISLIFLSCLALPYLN